MCMCVRECVCMCVCGVGALHLIYGRRVDVALSFSDWLMVSGWQLLSRPPWFVAFVKSPQLYGDARPPSAPWTTILALYVIMFVCVWERVVCVWESVCVLCVCKCVWACNQQRDLKVKLLWKERKTLILWIPRLPFFNQIKKTVILTVNLRVEQFVALISIGLCQKRF